MADKYIKQVNGKLNETEATVTSAGVADDGKIVGLDSTGRLDVTVMPVGIAPDTKEIAASENLSAGAIVNVFDNGGSIGVRNADGSSDGKDAIGFVLDAVTSAANAQVYFEGVVTGLAGLTAGSRYYLATTAGAITATPPSAATEVVQYVGRAVSATELQFEPSPPILLA